MIYQLLLILFRFALKQYFRHLNVYFEKPLPTDRPILYVANHQSAFMDAMLIGAQLEEPLHFVSRGESFNSKLKRWILSQFNMHPIYRKEFTPELVSKNPAAIQTFQDLLMDGKSILIFPEGISKTESRLSEIKPGAARIALGAYAAAVGTPTPVIVPVGLNYSNPHQFRSDVTLIYGTAIDLEKYADQYEADERPAVQALTDKITYELERLTLDIADEELEELISTVRVIYSEELLEQAGICSYESERVFNVKKELVKAAHYFSDQFPFRMNHMKIHIEHYRKLLANYEIEDCWLRSPKRLRKRTMAACILLLVIGFPIFAFGYVNHMIAFFLSRQVAKRGIKRPDFKGSFLLSFGVLFCLLTYVAQTVLVYYLTALVGMSILYLLSLPLIGKFSLVYFDFHKNVKRDWRRDYFQESNEEMIAYLKGQREQLMRLLNNARRDYMEKMAA